MEIFSEGCNMVHSVAFWITSVPKTSNESISFNLDGNKIDCEKEVKLLGVTIDYQLLHMNYYNLHK
jgi:hypothetical protein